MRRNAACGMGASIMPCCPATLSEAGAVDDLGPGSYQGYPASQPLGGSMRFRLTHACLGIFLGIFAACVLVGAAAHAFTVENKDEGGQYGVPKFNLEEQAKNFRKDGSDASSTGKSLYETPLGNGKLQFGVTQGPASGFGSVFSPGLGPSGSSQNSRLEFERRLAPPTSLEYNGVR